MRFTGLNIAFVLTRGDALGGATVHVRDLALELLDHGHRVTVLVGGKGEVVDELERKGVPYRSLKWLGRAVHPVKDVFAIAELRRVLRELKPALVCAHTAKAGLVGRVASGLAGVPALYTPHGWAISDRISRNTAWVFRLSERLVSPLSAAIINVCEAERQLAKHHRIAPDSRLAVIYNGVRDVDVELRAKPALVPPRILMVARFEPPKDPATLLEAVATIRDLPWTLEFVGGGQSRQRAQMLAGQLGLAARVTFSEGGADVAERLADSQIFVLSSRSEGFPLSVLEAMRAGLPVVGSDTGGVREAVVHGETGFLVKPGDAEEMGAVLRLLVTDGLARARLGRAGRRRYEMNFTFDRMFGQTLSLYHSVLSASGKAVRPNEAEVAFNSTAGWGSGRKGRNAK